MVYPLSILREGASQKAANKTDLKQNHIKLGFESRY